MRILVACEFSGVVRDAFIAEGHDAVSCDLLPTESRGPHYRGDVFDIIDLNFDRDERPRSTRAPRCAVSIALEGTFAHIVWNRTRNGGTMGSSSANSSGGSMLFSILMLCAVIFVLGYLLHAYFATHPSPAAKYAYGALIALFIVGIIFNYMTYHR